MTKPDSLIAHGLPGFNSANVALLSMLNKFSAEKATLFHGLRSNSESYLGLVVEEEGDVG
jgi:hypothetical protein